MNEEKITQIELLAQHIRSGIATEVELEKASRLIMLAANLGYDKLDIPFIHAFLGKRDHNGLSDHVLICPGYGAGFSVMYQKVDQ